MLAFEATYANNETKEQRKETALALLLGDIHISPPVVRIHSQCATGDIFHSLRSTDCHTASNSIWPCDTIAQEGAGLLIYEHQEGRGIGLMEKLRAYELQESGLDTIEANLHLGHPVDLRDYQLPIAILKSLSIRALRLLTNNPDKINAVKASGIKIVTRLSADVPDNPYAALYMATKREALGHFSGPISQFTTCY